ncbi:TolB family protein [Belliella kenyensis]|uniref:TolB family protein n=1 Tax=Belliella kenyensis TaxID=1472724 RepID=A0ABV8EES5_9BACT|nr:hypothetical protein [Belliella kenyensis]MCH7401916.1 hypothetical protein [Belliella kenyensis]MDN3604416.1 hypothetical protein [Belliella kenyensis]
MIKYVLLGIVLTLLSRNHLNAQGNSDLISIDVKKSGKKIELGQVSKITDRKGYDNQPSFINDTQMAFSSADDTGNFDIIIYNFKTGKFTNLTKTNNQNEYSPRLTDCGLYVSAVTVEESGKQRLWLYPTNFGEPELLYDDIEPVGYYDWYDNKAAMFVLGQPNTLIYPYSKDDKLTISENVGRTIRRQPKTSVISYIDKNDEVEIKGEQTFKIIGFDIKGRSYTHFGNTLGSNEDFVWLDKYHLMSAKGNTIYVKKLNEENWTKIGEVDITGYKNVSRMAYSKKLKKLILVMDRID